MILKSNVTIPPLTGDQSRRTYIYVPDYWEENHDILFPVLYMFDGHNVFFDEDATYGKSWGMKEFLESSGAPLIVAAVECNHDPNNGRLHEYSPFRCRVPGLGTLQGKGKITMDWIVNSFKPDIDSNFPSIPDRDHTFIGGSSMGGLMSLYAVLEYNHIFSRAAALSPSLWIAPTQVDNLVRRSYTAPGTVIYMDYGSRELPSHNRMGHQFIRTASQLLEKGVFLDFRIVPDGDHSEASWERQIPFFVDTLLYGLA